jgi:hypothetical protein
VAIRAFFDGKRFAKDPVAAKIFLRRDGSG